NWEGTRQRECSGLALAPPAGPSARAPRTRPRLLGRAPFKHPPPAGEAGDSQAGPGTEGPHAQPAGPPLGDPAPPQPFLPLIPRSAWGHDCALLSEGLTTAVKNAIRRTDTLQRRPAPRFRPGVLRAQGGGGAARAQPVGVAVEQARGTARGVGERGRQPA